MLHHPVSADSGKRAGRRQWLRCSIGAGALAAGGAALLTTRSSTSEQIFWRERLLLGFGTTLWLRAAHSDASRVDRALDAAVNELQLIESIFSLYRPNSQLSQLNAHGSLRDPDPRLVELLTLATNLSHQSDGAFDVSVQPLWALWQTAKEANLLPTGTQLRNARALVDWKNISVSKAMISLRPGMALTLNGIAQGYACDAVRTLLASHGIAHALLDTGEWSAIAPDYRAANWQLGLANPRVNDQLIATLRADGRSVATSSDAHTYFTDDREHHHIFDPATGRSPRRLASVTVLSDSAAKADALTKVFFMADRDLSSQARQRLAEHWRVDVLLVDKKGHWWASSGLPLAS